jgi:hypothetical protein
MYIVDKISRMFQFILQTYTSVQLHVKQFGNLLLLFLTNYILYFRLEDPGTAGSQSPAGLADVQLTLILFFIA